MAGRPDPRAQEGYTSPSPSSDPHDPFSNSQERGYYDNESEHNDYGRRDTYTSDGSQHGITDDDRYYDHHGPYDPYARKSSVCLYICA